MFAKLVFEAPGVESKVKSLSASFGNLKKAGAKVGTGIREVSQGIRGVAIATAPFSLFAGSAIKEAGKFEQSLDAVQSILRVNDEEMKKLAVTTKFLGATTKFTSSEANRGAQLFAQAGFSMQDTIAALPGVLNAAAAGEVSVADATNLVASNVRAFGLEAKESTKVADIMAETMALTNTTMNELGEGLKLSAAKLKGFGFSVAEGAAAIGVLSNVGVKATLAGTAIRNVLQKLAKPSKDTIAIFGGKDGLADAVTATNGSMLSLPEIMVNINQVMGKSKNKLEDMRKAAEIFGIRGEVAFGAFREQASETFKVTAENLPRLTAGLKASNTQLTEQDLKIGGTIPKLIALQFLIEASAGAAEKMARTRMGNFFGKLTELASAFNNLQIEIGSLTLGSFTDLAVKAGDAIRILTLGFQALNMSPDQFKTVEDALKAQNNQMLHMLGPAREFAAGFVEGYEEIKTVVTDAFTIIQEKFNEFSKTSGISAKELGKFVAKFIIIAAIAAPILAGLAAGFFVIGQVAIGLKGVFSIVSGSLGIIKVVAMGLWNVFSIGFTTIQSAIQLGVMIPFLKVIAIIAIVSAAVYLFRDTLIASGKRILGFFEPAFGKLKKLFTDTFQTDGEFTFGSGAIGKMIEFGKNIISIFKTVGEVVLAVILPVGEGMASIFAKSFDMIVSTFIVAFEFVRDFFSEVGTVISDTFSEIAPDIKQIFADVGAILDEIFGGDVAGSWRDTVMSAFTAVGDFVQNNFMGALMAVKIIFRIMGAAAILVLKAIAFGFKTIISVVKGVVSFIKDIFTGGEISQAIQAAFGEFVQFGKQIFQIFQTSSEEGGFFAGLGTAAAFAVAKIIVKFKELKPKLLAFFTSLMTSLVNKIKGMGAGITGALKGAFNFVTGGGDDDEKKNPLKGAGKPFEIKLAPLSGDVKGASDGVMNAAAQANGAANKTKAVASAPVTNVIELKDRNKGDQKIIVQNTLKVGGKVLARSVQEVKSENNERQGMGNISDFKKRQLVNRTGGN